MPGTQPIAVPVTSVECRRAGYRGAPVCRRAAGPLWRPLGEVRSAEEEFVEFADAASLQLRRTAFLLCGNWHTAEDLAQTTLAKMFVSWRKVKRRGAEHSYANRILVNIYLDGKRLKRSGEILTDRV